MIASVTFSTSTRSLLSKIIFLFLVSTTSAFPQVQQTHRFEFPLMPTEHHFDIIPAAENGLYLQRYISVDRIEQIQLVRLDTAFNQLWQGYVPIERNYQIVGKKSFGDKLYFLLRYRDFTKNDFLLYVVNHSNGGYTKFEIKSFIPFSPSEFIVTERAVLIGGYFNRVPLVLYFSTINYRSKVLPGLFNEEGELTQIKPYKDGSFDVLISARNYQRQRTIFIKNYDSEGDLLRSLPIETEHNKHLIFGRSLKSTNDVQLVAGVFGQRNSEFSKGIFVAAVNRQGLQQVRYYNFSDLENFFKFMKAKREQRVKERIQRRKIKGKKIRMNYRFLVHEIVPYKDQYVLLGEAFYPKYINLDRGYYMGFFSPSLSSRQAIHNGRIFDGYHYTHAVVMGFKENGDLVWDNSFEINDVKTFTLEQFVKLETQGDKIALLYLFNNKLRTKIIKDNDVLEGKTIDPIRTGGLNELVRKDEDDLNKLEYWYGDSMYAYGVQLIDSEDGRHRRRVFYINKVRHSK